MLDIIDGFFEMVFGDLIDICIEIGSLIYKSLMIMLLAGCVLAIVYIIYILVEDPINTAIDKRKHMSKRSKHKKHKKKKKKTGGAHMKKAHLLLEIPDEVFDADKFGDGGKNG